MLCKSCIIKEIKKEVNLWNDKAIKQFDVSQCVSCNSIIIHGWYKTGINVWPYTLGVFMMWGHQRGLVLNRESWWTLYYQCIYAVRASDSTHIWHSKHGALSKLAACWVCFQCLPGAPWWLPSDLYNPPTATQYCANIIKRPPHLSVERSPYTMGFYYEGSALASDCKPGNNASCRTISPGKPHDNHTQNMALWLENTPTTWFIHLSWPIHKVNDDKKNCWHFIFMVKQK